MNERRLPLRAGADSALLGARASVVNRTHRIIRAQALDMREQRRRRRSLWVPIAISSVLMLVVCYALWALMDGYDVTSDGIVDASDQLFLFLIWLLPASALLLGLLWSRRTRTDSLGEVSS